MVHFCTGISHRPSVKFCTPCNIIASSFTTMSFSYLRERCNCRHRVGLLKLMMNSSGQRIPLHYKHKKTFLVTTVTCLDLLQQLCYCLEVRRKVRVSLSHSLVLVDLVVFSNDD